MTDPATLSLADLAAAVSVDAPRLLELRNAADDSISCNYALLGGQFEELVVERECVAFYEAAWSAVPLLLAAANRLPAVVAECERLRSFAVCAWCGPYIKVDEDGCCAHCGADCMLVAEGRATVVPEHWRNDIDAVVTIDTPKETP